MPDRRNDVVKALALQPRQNALPREIHADQFDALKLAHDVFHDVGGVADNFAIFDVFKRGEARFSADGKGGIGANVV